MPWCLSLALNCGLKQLLSQIYCPGACQPRTSQSKAAASLQMQLRRTGRHAGSCILGESPGAFTGTNHAGCTCCPCIIFTQSSRQLHPRRPEVCCTHMKPPHETLLCSHDLNAARFFSSDMKTKIGADCMSTYVRHSQYSDGGGSPGVITTGLYQSTRWGV